MGARGLGELPLTGAAAAVANAVFNATGTACANSADAAGQTARNWPALSVPRRSDR